MNLFADMSPIWSSCIQLFKHNRGPKASLFLLVLVNSDAQCPFELFVFLEIGLTGSVVLMMD